MNSTELNSVEQRPAWALRIDPRTCILPLYLSATQVHKTIEGHARTLDMGFTEALLDLTEEVDVGRSTLFDWLKKGTPQRRERPVSKFYAFAVSYGVVPTADHEAAVYL